MADKCNSCRLIDLLTTPRILSQSSALSLELLLLARNFVNQVLCSSALTGKMRQKEEKNKCHFHEKCHVRTFKVDGNESQWRPSIVQPEFFAELQFIHWVIFFKIFLQLEITLVNFERKKAKFLVNNHEILIGENICVV